MPISSRGHGAPFTVPAMAGSSVGLRGRVLLALLALCAGLLLAGCETLGYYTQAAAGQMDLLFRRRPAQAVLDDPATTPALREQVRLALQLRDFAAADLQLDLAGRYRTVVDLDRDFVVWNLMAAQRFSLEPVLWCYPVAGCVAYRGYFHEDDARRKARDLQGEGYDVHVGGVAAYSTLGWFEDPLLSTFLRRGEPELAELLFHELAHGRLYVAGDTAFNESFASFVGREGVRRWLAAGERTDQLVRWQQAHERGERFRAFVLHWRQRMIEAYAASAGESRDRLEALRERLWAQMREAWLAERPAELEPWDRFFLAEASNARLNTVSDYARWVPAFRRILQEEAGDLSAFYARCEALAALTPTARSAALQALEDQPSSR